MFARCHPEKGKGFQAEMRICEEARHSRAVGKTPSTSGLMEDHQVRGLETRASCGCNESRSQIVKSLLWHAKELARTLHNRGIRSEAGRSVTRLVLTVTKDI